MASYTQEMCPWHSQQYLDYINSRRKPALRLVGVVRISMDKDDSSSIEVQKVEEVELAEERGAVIVGWAEDRDVSASKVPAFNRPQLKEWLFKRKSEFDGFLAWKIDRLTRNSKDTRRLVIYMEDNNKILWSVAEPFFRFDPNATGIEKTISDLLLSVLTMIAEMESENIKIRQAANKRQMRENALWPGGPTPYWTRTTKSAKNKKPGSGESLEIVGNRAEVVMSMINDILAGVGPTDIARRLNADGVPTPRVASQLDKGMKPETTGTWTATAVSTVLRHRMLVGEFVRLDGTVVIDKLTGRPREFVRPLVGSATFNAVQTALDKKSKRKTTPGTRGVALSGLINCEKCGSKILRRTNRRKNKNGDVREYHYYYCPEVYFSRQFGRDPKCDVLTTAAAAALESRFDVYLLENLAARPLTEEVYIPGSGSFEEIDALTTAIQNMVAERAKGFVRDDEFMAGAYELQIDTMKRDLARLKALGVTANRWEMKETGKSFYDEWVTGDWAKRRELIEESGLEIRIDLDRDIFVINDPLQSATPSHVPARHAAMIASSEGGE